MPRLFQMIFLTTQFNLPVLKKLSVLWRIKCWTKLVLSYLYSSLCFILWWSLFRYHNILRIRDNYVPYRHNMFLSCLSILNVCVISNILNNVSYFKETLICINLIHCLMLWQWKVHLIWWNNVMNVYIT